jgi:oxygen-independent coproporphyrinogen-3 oxidase
MRLLLTGHDYRYAVEQIMLMMYPDEHPEYSDTASGDLSAAISLSYGKAYASARTEIMSGGSVYRGNARVKRDALTDKLTTDRLLQKIIKLSFFKAALPATGKHPVWGALTGIRPGKLVTNMLERGFSEKKAVGSLVREYFVSPERAALCIDTAKACLNVKSSLKEKDIALYIGIPFCPTRCAYCSFVSHSVEKSMKLIEPFLEALYKEIERTAEVVHQTGTNIIAVYIGGGTPTTLSAEQLGSMLDKLSSSFDLTNVREYTVEAGRPDTITEEKLSMMRRRGVTRVSVNPQTMSDDVLCAIGRHHTAQDVLEAVEVCRRIGFGIINMDLIAGLPGDTLQSFQSTLDTVISLAPENITVHTLALKKGARVKTEEIPVPDGPVVSDMLDYAEKKLREIGYAPYYLYRQKFMSGGFENVGWSSPGCASLYNILIMEELCTILALGGGGVTKLVEPSSGRIERLFNAKYPFEYIDNIDRLIENKSRFVSFYRGDLIV